MLTNQRPAPWDGERAAVVGTELWLTAGVVPPSKSPFSCLARRSDTPTRVVDTGNQSPKGAWTAKHWAAGPTEAPLGPESTQRIPRQIGRR